MPKTQFFTQAFDTQYVLGESTQERIDKWLNDIEGEARIVGYAAMRFSIFITVAVTKAV